MMNAIWCGMVLIGVIYGIFTGNLAEVTNATLDSAKEAINLCITMLGIMAMWNGLMEIGSQSGIVENLSRGLSPMLDYLFPRIPRQHKAREYIAINFIANVLGLGWAATPAGLQAMTELKKLQEEDAAYDESTHAASDEMCTFLILNISSLQLIPINIIAYRSQYGSVNPAAVVVPGILATICSTLAAVLFCKVRTGIGLNYKTYHGRIKKSHGNAR